MGKLVANAGCSFQVTPNPPALWNPGTPNYTLLQALKEKLSGQPTLKQTVTWVLSPGACSWIGPPGLGGTLISGGGSMMATSLKKKCDGSPVMRQDDQGTCNGMIAVNQPSGPPVPTPCSCMVKILNAGQIKVTAE